MVAVDYQPHTQVQCAPCFQFATFTMSETHFKCSLVDTAVVGMRSATDLAALGPGTLCVDYATYVSA